MSTSIGDVLVNLRMDPSQLQEGANQANQALSGMGDVAQTTSQTMVTGAKEAGGAHDQLAEKLGGGGALLDEMERKGDKLGTTLKGAFLGVAGATGIGSLIDAAKNATIEMQSLGVQFSTTFGSGSMAALHSAINDANQFGVSISAAANAYQSFGLATKGANENMKADMKAFADIAAGTGQTIDQVASSIGNYYQLVQRQGGAGGQSSRFATSLLTQHMIDPATYNELRLQANQGASPQQLLQDIISNGESQYAGAGNKQSKTLGGEIQTFRNQFQENTQSSLSPLMKEMQTGLGDINKGMDSSGFRQVIKDFGDLTSVLMSGVALLAPFAKGFAEIAIGALSLVEHLGPLKILIEGLVAAFIAMKAVNIAQEMLGIGAATGTETAAVATNTAAVLANDAARGEGQFGSLLNNTPTMTSRMMNGTTLGLAGAIGGQVVGHAVGGTAGSVLGNTISGAGVGAMVGGLPGAGVGAAAGLVISAFEQTSQSAAKLSASVNSAVTSFEKIHPIGTTASTIDSSYRAAHTQFESIRNSGAFRTGGGDATPGQAAFGKEYATAAGAEYNKNQNMDALRMADPGLSNKDLGAIAAKNNIDLSQPLAVTAQSIENLGSAANVTAEALANKLANVGAQVGGQYGEKYVNPEKLLEQSHTNAGDVFKLAKQQGIDMSQYGLTSPSQLNQNMLTPQAAAQMNQTAGAANAMAQANEAVTQSENSATQAGWSLTQAYFSAGQAAFQLERSQVAANVANITYGSSVAAMSTVLNSGYLPANAQVAAQLAQATNLSGAQVNAINAEVSAYNALEATMYSTDSAGNSLFTTYTKLTNAVSELQAQTQKYTDLLNTPLAGTKEYSAVQQQYKEKEAAVQQQIDALELQRVPSQDPRVVSLQMQLDLLQKQASLSTDVNTQTVGAQQFKIQQAQIPSDTGANSQFGAQLSAAQSVGTLTASLSQAKQALDQVAPAYVAVNGQLTIQSQRNSAVTASLGQLAGATQTQITTNNALRTAANAVVTAEQGVQSAQWGVQSSGWAVQNALVAQNAAANIFQSQGAANFQAAMGAIEGSITSLGPKATQAGKLIQDTTQLLTDSISSLVDSGAQRQRDQGYVARDRNQITADTGGNGAAAANIISGFGSGLLPKLASGGIVNRPTVALVGEAGPEIVIPLSMLQQGGGALGGAGLTPVTQSTDDSTKTTLLHTQATQINTATLSTNMAGWVLHTAATQINTGAINGGTQASNTQTQAQGNLHQALQNVSYVSAVTASQIVNDQNNMAAVSRKTSLGFQYDNTVNSNSLNSVAQSVGKNMTAMAQMEEIMGAISQAAGEFANSSNQDAIVAFINQAEGLQASISTAGQGIAQGAVSALLASLPKYEAGGVVVAGGGVPIMAHPGEIVLTSAQSAALGGGGSAIGGGSAVALGPGDLSPQQFWQDLLRGLGAPDTPNNEAILTSWWHAESGNSWGANGPDHYNPLNTTLPWAGARSTNADGVKTYASWQDGLNALLATFLNTVAFAPIVNDFRANASHQQVSNDVARSGWGTGNFHNGGFVPGVGPVPATLHGGEFVISQAMLAAMGNGDHGAGGGGSGRTLVIQSGAIQVSIQVDGHTDGSLSETTKGEIVDVLDEALTQILAGWK